MMEHILFLTGKLAEKRLHKVLESMQPGNFSYEVRNIGVSVAALMTTEMLGRRLGSLDGADRVIIPGLCRGDLDSLTKQIGVPVVRGPRDVKDLPVFFGRDCQPVDLSKHGVLIFAEIVEAAELSVEEVIERAQGYDRDGADIIDIGCLPDTEFLHLEEVVSTLKSEGFRVSVDSLNNDELLRGARAGADYILSLRESTLWIADEVEAIPIIIPEHHPQIDSLYRSIDTLTEKGKTFIADSILDPIHFGFTASIIRYSDLRKRYPDIEIMMGIGNLTELTEADTSGINAILFGVISELDITSVLATQVSAHACSAVREADCARRMFYAAKQQDSLPKGINNALLTTHARKPFPYSYNEIAEMAADIKDPSFRIEVSEKGIHIYNRDGMLTADDPFALFPEMKGIEDDAPHAFYLGVELARAQVALQLGKQYTQDEELQWGAATYSEDDESKDQAPADLDLNGTGKYKSPGSTLEKSQLERSKSK